MKRFSKLMTAAAIIGLTVSCSDELSQSSVSLKKGDLVGTIETIDETRAGFLEQPGVNREMVFTGNDEVRVFTLNALTYHNYGLVGGEGTTTGIFELEGGQPLPDGQKYAVTEANNVFAVSATEDGNAQLTMTIDGTSEVSKERNGLKTLYSFPAPLWAECVETQTPSGIQLDATFHHLTGYMRVDMSTLPEGTKAIVLTTHGWPWAQEDENVAALVPKDIDHGYQLVAPGTLGVTVDDTNSDWAPVPYIYGGECDALSGTLTAELVDGAKLEVDPRLTHADTLRVNLDGIKNQVFYIPLVAGYYKQLDVLAVTGDSRYAYRWEGQLINRYQGKTVTVGGVTSLSMNVLNLEEADIETINYLILRNNNQPKRITSINVGTLVDDDGYTPSIHHTAEDYPDYWDGWLNNHATLPTDQIIMTGAGEVRLNIAEIATSLSVGGAKDKPLLMVDDEYFASVQEGRDFEADFATRRFTVNLPDDWATGPNTQFVQIMMPTTRVFIGTIDGNNSDIDVAVLGPKNKLDTKDLNEKFHGNYASYELGKRVKEGAVILMNGVNTLDILEGTEGDIYVWSRDQETEIADALNIFSTSNNDIRMDDALMVNINIVDVAKTSDERVIFATGSSAMQAIQELQYTGETLLGWPTGTVVAADPFNTHVESYYTGAGLSDYAWQSGYDNGLIFTVAQLQSMGESTRPTVSSYTNSQATYTIQNIVELFWLGDDVFRWVGPQVDIDDFYFDGNRKRLMNMYMLWEYGNDIYVDDPHYCCTSCGTPNLAGPIQLQNLGLIRSIIESGNATIWNVNLNDIMLVTDAEIDNIGSIVGLIDIDGSLDFEYNEVGEVKIDVNGDGVGGMIGSVYASYITARGNRNKSTKNDSGYLRTAKNYAGGLVGYLETESGDALFQGNAATNLYQVEMNEIEANEFAGGMIGAAKLYSQTAKLTFENYNVKINTFIKALEGVVGGLLGQGVQGQIWIGDNAVAGKDITVNVALLAGAKSVGGLVGNNTTRSTVYVNAPSITGKNDNKSKVSVTITKYENTYPDPDTYQRYTNIADLIYYGTMQDVVGLMQNDVFIYEKALTVSKKLVDTMKEAVLYKLHQDNKHNTTPGEYYWGDNHWYIGYQQKGQYFITDNKDVTSEINGEQLDGSNHYKIW